MAILDRLKYDAPTDSIFAWKHPSEELTLGTQLIVNQAQEAIFVKGGQALDVFGPGTHTLSSGNLPFLRKLVNLPLGGGSLSVLGPALLFVFGKAMSEDTLARVACARLLDSGRIR